MIYTKRTMKPYASNSIWAIWISAAVIYAVYAYLTGQYAFVLSNGITAVLCGLVFILRLIHQHRQQKNPALPMTIHDIGLDAAAIVSSG
jgi:amino acid transporter